MLWKSTNSLPRVFALVAALVAGPGSCGPAQGQQVCVNGQCYQLPGYQPQFAPQQFSYPQFGQQGIQYASNGNGYGYNGGFGPAPQLVGSPYSIYPRVGEQVINLNGFGDRRFLPCRPRVRIILEIRNR